MVLYCFLWCFKNYYFFYECICVKTDPSDTQTTDPFSLFFILTMPCTDFQQYRKTSLKHFGSNTELSSLSKTKIKELSIHETILLFSVQTLDYFACFWECLWNIMRFNLLGSTLCIFRSSAKIPKKKWDTNDHLFGLVYLRAKMLNCCSMYCITNNEN